MDIYWIKDRKTCGPGTVPDVIALVQMEELTPESLGWHTGCDQWMPLKDLPALSDFLQRKEPKMEGAVDDTQTAPRPENLGKMPEMTGNAVHLYLPPVGQRVAAHLVDASLYAALVCFLLYATSTPFHLYLMPSHPLFWLPMVLLEAWLLNRKRATPGMSLFGIVLSTYNREPDEVPPMSFWRVLRRSFQVYIWGTGMYMFPMSLLMPMLSYFMMRKQGITLWDFRCLTMPVQKKPAPASRLLVAAAVIFVSFYTTSLCLQPWVPEIMHLAGKESPEMVSWLEKWIPTSSTQEDK